MSHQDFALLKEKGVMFNVGGSPPEMLATAEMALDAQPSLTTTPNNGIPAYLTTVVSPNVIEVLFSPNKAANILGEVKMGDWTQTTAMVPMIEYAGEVSSYGDFNNNGMVNVNPQFEYRTSYLYQTIIEYGELEEARTALARINWAAAQMKSAVTWLNKFQNLTYFFGVAGIANYGLLNDPSLSASLTPATKAATGTAWFVGNSPNATANEVYNDILATFQQLVNQTAGLIEIDQENRLVLALSPQSATALAFTNPFGLTTRDMLKNTFPNIRIETAVQYGAVSGSNVQGNPAGNFMQLIAENLGGQDTGFCAYNEKLRTHRIVADLSSFRQKATQGSFGAIITQPAAVASMVGI